MRVTRRERRDELSALVARHDHPHEREHVQRDYRERERTEAAPPQNLRPPDHKHQRLNERAAARQHKLAILPARQENRQERDDAPREPTRSAARTTERAARQR